ncbi:DegT/DnrJ/EryC1/StrS family aminotransferase [Polynucleobacter paneuropaeus]|nr:DegT/DnrJ/EryC1/StrS family aminotransferase [Polynucleobacter paneuropaeus]QWD37459.1 DegT/DnrJ/EryC1/StrS family aminotransferase [Polynucleobacter paneuropaeus]
MNSKKPIYVTQPYLPDLKEFYPYLEAIWESKNLTNGGIFHQQLEEELCRHLGVKYISLFSNGTIALVVALQALGIKGEVITTPYSFVATTNALMWNGISPVFTDIDPISMNLDPKKIEAAISGNTQAILPVHCYGAPCDVEKIQEIANKHQLKIIYDASHAFGVNDGGQSLLNYGDLSTLSFHATKIFNTFEGGAIISHTAEMKRRVDQLKNFGFVDEVTVVESGINGKMSEINAAFGLLQLKHMPEVHSARKNIAKTYNIGLENIKGIVIPEDNLSQTSNHSYYPILVDQNFPISRDQLYEKLKSEGIFSRRYFYPLISEFPMYKNFPSSSASNLPVATKIANEVLCLPIYPGLSEDSISKIIQIITTSAE